MKSRLGYVPEDAIYPFKGVNYLIPPIQLQSNYSPDVRNMIFEDHVGAKAPLFNTELAVGMNGGGTNCLALIPFEDVAGTSSFVGISDSKEWKNVSGTWTNITGGTARTGDVDNPIHYAIGMDGSDSVRYLYIVNGKDTLKRWDGSGNFADAVTGITNFTTCKTVATYRDRLVLGNVKISSTFEPLNIYWTTAGDFTDFTSGTSGIATLADAQGEILAMAPLGDQLVIYTTSSIILMTDISGDVTMSFQTIVKDFELLSSRSIVTLQGVHLIASTQGFYQFDGTRLLRRVGEVIEPDYREKLSTTRLEQTRSHAFHDERRTKVYWFIRGADNLGIGYVLDYNGEESGLNRWSKVGDVSTVNSAGVSDLDTPVFGKSGPIKTMKQTSDITNETGTITTYWDSKDFVIPERLLSENARWVEVELQMKGTQVSVDYSTDAGDSFAALKVDETLTSTWTLYKYYLDTVSRTIRIRLKEDAKSKTFDFRFLRVWLRPGGAR